MPGMTDGPHVTTSFYGVKERMVFLPDGFVVARLIDEAFKQIGDEPKQAHKVTVLWPDDPEDHSVQVKVEYKQIERTE